MRSTQPGSLTREEMIDAVRACECGFESASGFRDAFFREFGRPPGANHAK